MLNILPNQKTKILAGVAIVLGVVDFLWPTANVSIELGGTALDTPTEFISTGVAIFLGRDIIQKFQPLHTQ